VSEHAFEEFRGEWERLAEEARRLCDADAQLGRGVKDPPSAEAAVAFDELTDTIARAVGPRVADWSTTRWLLTKTPIAECVAAEVAEDRPYRHGGPRSLRTTLT
jgi:hypothetical protein